MLAFILVWLIFVLSVQRSYCLFLYLSLRAVRNDNCYGTVSVASACPCVLASSRSMMFIPVLEFRHNGNIMIDRAGHVIHIDFGFVFGLGKKSD